MQDKSKRPEASDSIDRGHEPELPQRPDMAGPSRLWRTIDRERSAGPFEPATNEALARAFGADLSDLTASFDDTESTEALGAEAYTRGKHMAFGPGITQDLADHRSMEVIGHEVAHALGDRATRTAIDQPDGAAETAARDVGRDFAGWVSGREARPELHPVAGEAEIHRMSVGGPGGLKDPVHEELTLQTLVRAGLVSPDATLWNLETIEYLRGVYWNDDPESLQFRDGIEAEEQVRFATGIRWLLRYLFGDEQHDLTARSHHGDLQFLHGMAGKDGEPPEVTRGNAGVWARFTIEVALGRIPGDAQLSQTSLAPLFPGKLSAMRVFALFGLIRPNPRVLQQRATGSLLHLVQDSHAQGHTERNTRGEIVEFHSYAEQDRDEHAEYDAFHGKQGGVESIPGGVQAVDHGARVLELLSGGDPEVVIEYVMDEVLRLAPDARPASAGSELRKKRPVDVDNVVAPEGFEEIGRDVAGGIAFRAQMTAVDGSDVTFTLQFTNDAKRGENWLLWKSGKLTALAGGTGFPTTSRLYLEINPALGYRASTVHRR